MQLFSHIPLPAVTTVEKLCAEQLLLRMHNRLRRLQASHDLLFVLCQGLVQVEVHIMVKLVSEWILAICIANSGNNSTHT